MFTKDEFSHEIGVYYNDYVFFIFFHYFPICVNLFCCEFKKNCKIKECYEIIISERVKK